MYDTVQKERVSALKGLSLLKMMKPMSDFRSIQAPWQRPTQSLTENLVSHFQKYFLTLKKKKFIGFGMNYRKNVLAGILQGYSCFIPNQQI